MASCCRNHNKNLQDIKESRKSGITRDELEEYIEEHAELWAMLSVNLGLSEEKCKEIATRMYV
jgi:hypothetical protein|tara:strand:- start:336 stop:524 length:189 start_codon:yes stop_codon:yes gene_type:complete